MSSASLAKPDHWSKILQHELPFASPDKLYAWAISYNEDAFSEDPYKETYEAVSLRLAEWSNTFIEDFALYNPKYINQEVLKKDFLERAVMLLNHREHTSVHVEICALDLLQMVSGLQEGFSAHCYEAMFDTEVRDRRAVKSVERLLKNFCMPVVG